MSVAEGRRVSTQCPAPGQSVALLTCSPALAGVASCFNALSRDSRPGLTCAPRGVWPVRPPGGQGVVRCVQVAVVDGPALLARPFPDAEGLGAVLDTTDRADLRRRLEAADRSLNRTFAVLDLWRPRPGRCRQRGVPGEAAPVYSWSGFLAFTWTECLAALAQLARATHL